MLDLPSYISLKCFLNMNVKTLHFSQHLSSLSQNKKTTTCIWFWVSKIATYPAILAPTWKCLFLKKRCFKSRLWCEIGEESAYWGFLKKTKLKKFFGSTCVSFKVGTLWNGQGFSLLLWWGYFVFSYIMLNWVPGHNSKLGQHS